MRRELDTYDSTNEWQELDTATLTSSCEYDNHNSHRVIIWPSLPTAGKILIIRNRSSKMQESFVD